MTPLSPIPLDSIDTRGVRDAVVARMLLEYAPLRALGERGRRFCEADTDLHLEHLTASASTGVASIYAAYCTWARAVLEARGIAAGALRLNLRIMREVLTATGGALATPVVLATLTAGEAALGGPPLARQPADEGVREYVDGAVRGDRHAVLDRVARWQREGGPELALHRLADGQRLIGDRWLYNELSVADEHRATALAQLALGTLVPFTAGAPGPRPLGRAVVACAPGDWHAVGPRIAADLLELEGYEVEFLGANTPAEELARACLEISPVLVGVGVAPISAIPQARRAIEAVRGRLPGVRVVAGGFGAQIAGASALGADEVFPSDFSGAHRAS